MAKTYKEYCLEALKKSPDVYKTYFLEDGMPKPFPSFAGFYKKIRKDMPREELKSLPKDGFHRWPINKTKVKTEAKIKITGTQLFMSGKNISMEILPLPKGQGMRAYNKVWMHNYRVVCRIKKLKEKFGITFEL